MTLYLDRATRVVPPRDATTGAGACRTLACNASTTSVELDNDIFQIAGSNQPGSYGRALVQFHADGNDIYLLFGPLNSVAANSAAVSGNTQAMLLSKTIWTPPLELDPAVDKWMSARTANGGGLTATLRYRIVSFPTRNQAT